MKRARLAAIVGASWCLSGCAGAPPGALADLPAALAELQARPELAGGRIGVCVVDGGTGERLVAAAADRGFATASNMKLVSSAVALTTLGPEHCFRTELWQRGVVANGTLTGELILRGHGDPSFGKVLPGHDPFAPMVAALREAGVQRFVGRIVGDGSWLGTEHLGLGWQWDYLDEDYAAPFGGLCCAGNVVTVRVRPGQDGPVVEVAPDVLPPPRVRLQQVAAGVASRVAAHRALGSEIVEVSGTIAADALPQTIAVPVPDPATFAARVLRAHLVGAGIEVEDRTDAVPTGAGEERLVATVTSPPLAQLLRQLLGDSDNLYAEQVVRSAAREATGDGGTAATARHVAAVLGQLGVDTAGMVVADGSGLSRRNLVQPWQLVGVLAAMWRSPHRDVFVQALPLAGRTGTLRTRFRDGPASGRVRAKTGFIARVVCLSGYVPRPEAHAAPLFFSVMLNDFTCDEGAAKAAVDAFVQRLATAAGW